MFQEKNKREIPIITLLYIKKDHVLKHLTIILLSLIFLIILSGCNGEPIVPEQTQEIQLPFRSIIIERWDKNLLDLQEIFPGGALQKGNIKENPTPERNCAKNKTASVERHAG